MKARKNSAHEMVIECLTQALLQLMAQKPFSKISISELCQRAGVGRISFYRNYNSMQEILSKHLTKCMDDWWDNFVNLPQEEFADRFWIELFEQYRANKELLTLLYKNDLSPLLKEHIFLSCGPSPEHDNNTAFIRSMLAGMIYGLVDEWICRDMPELENAIDIHRIVKFINEEGIIAL